MHSPVETTLIGVGVDYWPESASPGKRAITESSPHHDTIIVPFPGGARLTFGAKAHFLPPSWGEARQRERLVLHILYHTPT